MQRKLNARFLVILTAIIGGGLLLFVVGGKYLFRGTAQKHIAMAELYTREGRMKEAAEEYRLAISRDPRNAEVYVKLGETMRLLTRTDPFMVDKDKFYWNMALEVDPSYLPAMQRLLDAHLEDSQLWPIPQTFARVRDVSTRILSVDPTDVRARASLHIAWVQSWLSGVEIMPQQLDESMKELAALQEKDATNVEVPFLLARARVTRATNLAREGRDAEAAAVLVDAERGIEAAMKATPDSPRIHLRQGQILLDISAFYRRDDAKRRSYRELGIASIARATKLVKSDDPAHLEVKMAAAAVAQQDQKLAEAEAIYRELLAQRPEDRAVRLALAQLVSADPAKRPEAIVLLEESVSDDMGLIGARVRLRNDLQMRTLQVLTSLRIEAAAAAKTDEDKKQLQEKVNEHLKEIYDRQGESPEYLKLKGRYYQSQNQFVDAIQTYNRAAALLAQANRPQDDDMMFQLARVYVAAQQIGEARAISEDLVRRHEAFIPARVLLARLLLTEGSLDKAKPHLTYLEKNAGSDPQVIALLLATAPANGGAERSRELLRQLPERTRQEKIVKARSAYESRMYDETLRLTGEMLKDNAGDEDAATIAIQTLLQQKKAPEARKQLDASLAANPDARNLKLIKSQLDGSNQIAIIEENVEEIKDEFTRELAKARLADALGKGEDALGHIKRAEEIKPDAPEAWDMLFLYYAREKQWDKLQPYLQKLIAANHDRANGLLYQFRLAMAKGEVESATETGRQLTIKLPEFAQSWLAYAQSLQAARRFDEAIEAFLRVLEKQATNVDAYRGLVESCYGQRRYDNAGRHILEGRRRMPGNPVLRQLEIDHELNFGQPEKVIGLIEAQAAQQLDKPQAWLLLGRAYERILQRKAAKSDPETKPWLEKLRDHYAKAFEKWPENPEFATKYSEAHILLGSRVDAENVLQRHAAKVGDQVEPALLLADFYVRTNQPSHAEVALKAAIERFRDKPELWQRLASVQAGNGNPDAAIKTLESAPNSPQVLMQKLEIMLQAGKIADAKKMIAQTSRTTAEEFHLLNAQAFIALQENDIKAARDFAEKSLLLRANNPVALQQRAMAKLRDARPDTEGAIIDLKLAIQQMPANVELRVTTADAYLARQDRESAIRELEMAANFAPRNRTVWPKLLDLYVNATPPRLDDAWSLIELVRAAGGNQDVDLAIQAARVAAARKDVQTAINTMQRAVELAEGHEAVVREYMVLLIDLGKFQQMLQESQHLLEQAPKSWWVRHLRALAQARQGNREAAIGEWEKAIAIADADKNEQASFVVMQGIARELGVSQVLPRVLERAKQEPRWIIFAASLYQTAGDWRNAVAMAEQAIAAIDKLSKDEQVRAMQVAGAVYLAAKPAMADKATKVYTRLLQDFPEDLATLNNLACLYVDNMTPPDPAKALEFSQRAYDAMRKQGLSEPLVMDTHGWVLVHAGRVQEGIVLLQDVVQKNPFLEARYHLAEAYLKGNYPDAAVRQLNEVNAVLNNPKPGAPPADPAFKTRVDQAMAKAVGMVKQQAEALNRP